MDPKPRPVGMEGLGDLSLGTHFCLFYETEQDFLETLAFYFKTGLAKHEFCLWVTPDSFENARVALRQVIPYTDQHLEAGNIDIRSYQEWFFEGNVFDATKALQGFDTMLAQALEEGYARMRALVDEAWLDRDYWQAFSDYEGKLDERFANKFISIVCAYPTATREAAEILDIARTHRFIAARRKGNWETLEAPELKHAKVEAETFDQDQVQERTADLRHTVQALQAEIIEHRQSEEALHLSEERLREYEKVVEGLEEMIVVIDREYRYIIANQAFLDYRGMTREQVVGRLAPEVLNKDVFDELVKPKLEECFQGKVVRYELDYTYPVRGERHLLLSYFPIEGPNGIDRAACILQDITEQKQAEAERVRLFEELRHSHDQLMMLSRRLVEVQEAERQALTTELHDRVGQNLTGLSINLQNMKALLPPQAAQALASKFDDAQALVQDTTRQIRDIMAELHPPELEDYGLAAALETYAEQAASRGNLKLVTDLPDLAPPPPPPYFRISLFRAAQEAISNVLKHAGATQLEIGLEERDGRIQLMVEDNGRGFEPDSKSQKEAQTWGLKIMRERIESIGGNVRIESKPGEGTQVIFDIEKPS